MRICPYCKKQHEAAMKVEDGKTIGDFEPEPGSVGLCVNCGEWMILEEGGARKPTNEEHVDIGFNPDCQAIRKAWVIAQGSAQG